MASKDLYLVVMAGGSGTRFWPKSTSKRPKQFLAFGQDPTNTLLVQTLRRFDGIVDPDKRFIATTQALSGLAQEQAGTAKLLAEPQGRNTAPCIYWAARTISEINPQGVMLVMPSDHFIAKADGFRSTLKTAASWAMRHPHLVTLGVKPTRPETGYGYLKLGQGLEGGCHEVAAFVEKPNETKANEFFSSGQYLWNGGMFLWRVDTILEAFDQHMPEMKRAWESCKGDLASAYPLMTATSIDYGVMEKAKNVVTFALDCGWDDMGSWTSLEQLAEATPTARRNGGAIAAGEMVAIESSNCFVDAPGKLVALLGVKDLIVAQCGDSILVAKKDRTQEIKQVVEAVKKIRPDLT